MSFIGELWQFMRERKKFWLMPLMLLMLVFGLLGRPDTGVSGRAVYLYHFLTEDFCR